MKKHTMYICKLQNHSSKVCHERSTDMSELGIAICILQLQANRGVLDEAIYTRCNKSFSTRAKCPTFGCTVGQ